MTCRRCAAQNRDGARFCDHCGAPLDVTTGREESLLPPRAHVPAYLAGRVLTSRSAREGERKQVTVLFADVKGSLELLHDRDAEDARRVLDGVLELMMEAVHRYEGTVNQVMGDGIMALFGAPLAVEDHAVRACYAALRMQDVMRRDSETLRRSVGIDVRIRIGLNSGEVIVRSIGSDLRMDYTAVGRTTQLAARMEQLAHPGTIRLTAATARLVEGYFEVKSLGAIAVKGLPEPLHAFELIAAASVGTSLRARVQRGLTSFVGRESELAQLRRALERAAAGHGQIVGIVGEAGVGKSRLVYEFLHSDVTRDWGVFATLSVSYGRATPYLPVIGLLQDYFQIQAGDDARTTRERVSEKLIGLDPGLASTLTPLLALLGAVDDEAQWRALDSSQRRRLTLDAVERLLLFESELHPVVLLFDDLHWIDSETQALLDRLVESLPPTRILVLAGYRPEYQHAWANKSYYTQVRIHPLPEAEAENLMSVLLGGDPMLGSLKRLLIERTEGNPFFLEESVRDLVETGALTGERETFSFVKDLRSIQVPATIQAVLAARIDRLPEEDKRLLQSAAVVGKDVSFAILYAIADVDESTLHQSLSNLQAAQFLHETRVYPELEYTFKHALTHEVAYGSLLQNRRRALHSRILDALERLQTARHTQDVELLAHHAVRGEAWPRAVRYLRQAGARAASRSAHRQAVEYFEQALSVIHHLPESRETMEQAVDLRFDLRNSLHPIGDFAPVLGHLSEAEKLASILGDQRRLAWVFSFMCQYFRLIGERDRAVESGQRAVEIAHGLNDIPLWIAVGTHLGPAFAATGDFRRAAELLTEIVEVLRENPAREYKGSAGLLSVFSRIYLVYALAERGDFREGIPCGEEAIRIAASADHQYSLASAYCGMGTLLLIKGDVPSAVRMLEPGLQLCRALTLPLMLPLVASPLGSAYSLSGRHAEGIALLEEAVSQAASIQRMGERSILVTRLGEAYLLAGRIHDAARAAQSALDFARQRKERGCEAYALQLAGKIGLGVPDSNPYTTETAFRQARALAAELGMRPLQAHCDLGLGALYRSTGRRADAKTYLAAAVASFRSLEMPLGVEQAEGALQSLA